jgi:hypothetical protein
MQAKTGLTIGAVLLVIAGCGGGGGGNGGGTFMTPPATNVAPITVDSGPAGTINIPFVTVTVCIPATSTCQTIDHVEVDTGSSGLRLLAPVLSSSLALPASKDANGNPMAECLNFADGHIWGALRIADVSIGGEQVNGLTVHVIADPAFQTVPTDCTGGPLEDTVLAFGANGLLGLSTAARHASRPHSRARTTAARPPAASPLPRHSRSSW